MKTKIAMVAVSAAAFCAFGETWYFNSSKNVDTTSQANGNRVITNANAMSYWTNSLGQAGSGLPGPDDDLVFDGSKGRIRINAQSFNSFGGHSLQIGTANVGETLVYDGGHIYATKYPLKLWYSYFFCNSQANRDVTVPIQILAEDPNRPAVICVGNIQYAGYTYSLMGPITGSANAQLRFGPWQRAIGNSTPTSASNTTFRVDDITGYAGTITVTSAYQNVGAAFGTRLRLYCDSQTSPAKIRVGRGGSLSLKAFGSEVTVKELSLTAGSRLYFNHSAQTEIGKLWHVRATDALTVDGPVELCDMPIVRGIEHYRIPILTGPAGSRMSADDFTISYNGGTQYNLDLHLEVDDDAETGDRTLYVVTHGFVYQTSNYTDEGAREGGAGAPSSLTNDVAWWKGLAPHPTNSLAQYRTSRSLRTLYAPEESYAFPCSAFRLQNGTLIIQTRTFEVPEFYCDGGTIGIGQYHVVNDTIRLVAPLMHFTSGRVEIRSWVGCTVLLDGELDGPGDIRFASWPNTSEPKSNFGLTGINTNYTGSIFVSQNEYRPQYTSFDNKFPTLYVNDGRNLGGRKATFDPRALTLTHLAKFAVTNGATVTLADGLNRGVYMWEKARFDVAKAEGVLDVQWPLLLSGKMWKEGPGTLILGKGMKHEVSDGGELSDVPRAGSNLFEIVAGTVKIANADALAGVETTIDAGASIQLVLDPDDADLMKYGIRNTTADAPFTLDASFGGKLPLTVDANAVPPPTGGKVFTNGVITVNSTAATAIAPMLAVRRPWAGVASKMVPIEEDGMVTFALVSKRVGTVFCFR